MAVILVFFLLPFIIPGELHGPDAVEIEEILDGMRVEESYFIAG
jgi:hypothetical protein